MYHAGLRVGEAVALQIRGLQNTRTPEPRLHVRNIKGGKDRYVPLASGASAEKVSVPAIVERCLVKGAGADGGSTESGDDRAGPWYG